MGAIKSLIIKALGALGLSIYARELYHRFKLLFDPELRRKNRNISMNPPDGLPLPPIKLVYLVIGRFDLELFFNSGQDTPHFLKESLKKISMDIGACGPILDFGCGCGRSIRHLKEYAGLGLYGTDYNPALIDWCRNNLSLAEFRVNDLSGRTSYDDGQFGLVYAISVFTHFEDDLQRFWMKEMARIIRPGGFLLATTHGDDFLGHLAESQKSLYLSGNLVVLRSGKRGSNECAAYHPEQYMKRLVSGLFEPVVHTPGKGWQDVWLLRRSRT
jgi:SAM-dependent methyltransferase